MIKRVAVLLALMTAPAYAGIDFEESGPAYMESASAALAVSNGDVPYTIAYWQRVESTPAAGVAFSVENGTSRIRVFYSSTGTIYYETAGSYAVTTNTSTLAKWQLVVAVAAADNDRYVVLDDDWANRGTSTTTTDPLPNTTGLGISTAGNGSPFDGTIAYLTIWNVALTQDEITALNNGKHPLTMHPNKILHFWPLNGDGGPTTVARDLVGNVHFDIVTGTPTKSDSPPVRTATPFYGSRLTDPTALPFCQSTPTRCREEDYRAAA